MRFLWEAELQITALGVYQAEINGQRVSDADRLVQIVAFDDVNGDGFSSGRGKINCIRLDGKIF